ncbi:Co2+/Mg2+ efflux protein ApaG [Thalassotalea atypica]|uniref:Co2+/Mg2+ efflux protein ApaG n=1 Tax=Thalassotalea atypica TaxID=2054316 RepID=UPI0025743B3F|nr:Co2+/Mg2+ efflux protein ApaG [Thalassotalea atypica]
MSHVTPDLSSLITVLAQPNFIESQSDIDNKQFVFSYTITISNCSDEKVQLLSRRWLITDANGEITTVEGDGVVGQQPVIGPGKQYTYTSGSIFKTPLGIMQGQYHLIDSNNRPFSIEIPLFRLSVPNLLN